MTRSQRKDGQVVDVDAYGVPLLMEGHLRGILVMYQDVTEQRRAELALRERTNVLNTLIASSPIAIVVQDAEGRLD